MKNAPKTKLQTLPNPELLALRVADLLLNAAMEKNGPFAVALSGGSTPRRLYERLAEPPYLEKFPWSKTHWFWGDERFVPHDDARSNYKMASEALLLHAPIPDANIHPIPTEGVTPFEAALAYERVLKSFYGVESLDPGRPLFDVTLLGLGEDGHTASLFPGTAALTNRDSWAAPVSDAKMGTRITLTYPALESSRDIAFLVEGKEKRTILERLREGDSNLPAAPLFALETSTVFADAAAAGETGE